MTTTSPGPDPATGPAPLRVVIADDEPLSRRRLEIALAAIADVAIVGQAADGVQAQQLIGELQPDIAILDIDMPALSGIELVARLDPGSAPVVIFLTAFEAYALRAFEVAAQDYLLKPLRAERLTAALDRARHLLATKTAEERLAQLERTVRELRAWRHGTSDRGDEFWIQRHGEATRVSIADINWLEAEGDYVRLHTAAGIHLHRTPLGEAERLLDPAEFTRIHRSTIVRNAFVGSIRRNSLGRYSIVLRDGSERGVGRKYLPALRHLRQREG